MACKKTKQKKKRGGEEKVRSGKVREKIEMKKKKKRKNERTNESRKEKTNVAWSSSTLYIQKTIEKCITTAYLYVLLTSILVLSICDMRSLIVNRWIDSFEFSFFGGARTDEFENTDGNNNNNKQGKNNSTFDYRSGRLTLPFFREGVDGRSCLFGCLRSSGEYDPHLFHQNVLATKDPKHGGYEREIGKATDDREGRRFWHP